MADDALTWPHQSCGCYWQGVPHSVPEGCTDTAPPSVEPSIRITPLDAVADDALTADEERLADLLAEHGDYHVNDDGWTVCLCGHVVEGDDDDGSHARHLARIVRDQTAARQAETHREVAESMTGLWQAERERADRLEAMCDRLAERLVVLPDLWREEGRGVLFNRAGDDLTPQARIRKWLHEKTTIPGQEARRG